MQLHRAHGLWWPYPDGREDMLRACPREVAAILEHVRKRRVVVQAGGNAGVWPLYLSERFKKVWTFEAEPRNFAALAVNTATRANIVAIHAALGSRIGMSDLVRSPKERFGGSAGSGQHQVYERPGDCIGWMIDALGLERCDLIMLDIEGGEHSALRGAAGTIGRCRPVIAVEINRRHDQCGSSGEAMRAWLAERGYREAAKAGADRVFVPA